jgi:hypothetical protein
MMHTRGAAFLLSAAIVLQAAPSTATTTDEAAAIVTYPLIAVEPANGVDTFVQLVNDGDSPVDVKCFLDDQTRHCLTAGSRCLADADCPSGDSCAVPAAQVIEFDLTLTEGQPISWQALQGRATLPLPANNGAIPPVPALPFRGVLRCLTMEAGAPSDRNVLRGAATYERYDAPEATLDRARHNAVGNRAIPGASNGDTELVLGGPNPEYEGCANAVLMDFLFDFTLEPVRGDQILNTLVAVPCAGTLWDAAPVAGSAILQFLVYNEFEQPFSTSRVVEGQMVRPLSTIDTNQSTRSIFSAGVAGTPGGRLRLTPVQSGVIAYAVEQHRDVLTDGRASAAFDLATQGERSEADVLRAGAPPICPSAPRAGCKIAPRDSFSWTDKPADAGDRLLWRFRGGEPTSASDLGQPQSTTSYALCVYGGALQTHFATLQVPAGSPAWSSTNGRLRYGDSDAVHDGVRIIQIRPRRGRTRLIVRGRGESLPDVDLSGLIAPVVVQLNNDAGACWQSTFSVGEIIASGADEFRAKGGD